jgi:hypothetical protein
VIADGEGSTRYGLKDWKLKRVVVVVHPDNTPLCAQRSDLAAKSAAAARKGSEGGAQGPYPTPSSGPSAYPAGMSLDLREHHRASPSDKIGRLHAGETIEK